MVEGWEGSGRACGGQTHGEYSVPQGVVVGERVTIPEKEGRCSRGTEEAVVTNEEMDVSGVERRVGWDGLQS